MSGMDDRPSSIKGFREDIQVSKQQIYNISSNSVEKLNNFGQFYHQCRARHFPIMHHYTS